MYASRMKSISRSHDTSPTNHASWVKRCRLLLALGVGVLLLGGCSIGGDHPELNADAAVNDVASPLYRIGPGDNVRIFVWRNAELSNSVPVRPDGKITTPLVEDLQAAGKTPTQLARDVEEVLSTYIKSPVVTIIVTGFSGPFSDQIRVLGEASQPRALNYQEDMTLLDVMIQVGGLTDFADGNEAVLVRREEDTEKQYVVRLEDLIKRGDIKANARVLPGDVLIIPEALF